MKKVLFLLVGIFFSLAMTLTSVAYTAPTYVGNHEVAIGGITLGSTEEYVRSVYGAPDEVTYSKDSVFGEKHTARYGNSFFITYGKTNHVIKVETTANNGLKTPSGISVGQAVSAVTDYYPKSSLREGKVKNGNRAYFCNGSWTTNMSFEYNNKKKITSISIYVTP